MTGLSPWQRVCDNKNISIPMMSKTGLHVSGMYEGTLRVFRIGQDGKQREEVFDSKAVTGRADFSLDDRSLIYFKVGGSHQWGDGRYRLLTTHRAKPIYHASASTPLIFPAFLNPDEITVHDRGAVKLILLERTRSID